MVRSILLKYILNANNRHILSEVPDTNQNTNVTETNCDTHISMEKNELCTMHDSLPIRYGEIKLSIREGKPHKWYSESDTFAQLVSKLLSLIETKFDHS